MFDRKYYLEEIAALLSAAKAEFLAQHPEARVYTINVWTDPNAAASAVSFDTREHSESMIAYQNRQTANRRERLLASGDIGGAERCHDQEGRVCNPADFAYPNIAECTHASMLIEWENISEDKCWDILEPIMLDVRESALHKFADIPLDQDAELSVNSQEDWYDHPCHLGRM